MLIKQGSLITSMVGKDFDMIFQLVTASRYRLEWEVGVLCPTKVGMDAPQRSRQWDRREVKGQWEEFGEPFPTVISGGLNMGRH
jgi:hypothetical protein